MNRQPGDTPTSLSSNVARGAAWLAGGRLLVRAIGLVSTVILARLLLPEDFGLVALATSLVFVLETLSDLRFEQAIIAQRDTADSDLNTAWTLNLLRGLAVAGVIAAAAFPYAWLMDDVRLAPLLLTLATLPLLDGLKNPGFVTFEKSMVFHQEFKLQLSHKLAAFAVTVLLALLIRSYWALVAGMFSGALARVAASYLMHPFRPRPALSGWRRLVAFSGWLMGANLLRGLMQKAEFFMIGLFLPVRVVGLYHVGSDISNMATNEAVVPVRRALFPAFSSLVDEPQRQYRSFRRALEVVAALALPLGIGLALVAEPFVLLALGEKWRDAAQVISYLGPAAVLWSLAGLCDTLTISTGRTRLLFSREVIMAAYLFPAYLLGIWLAGLQGILVAAVVVAVLSLLISLDMVRRLTGQPLLRPLQGTWRSLAATLAMTLLLTSLRIQHEPAADAGTLFLHLGWLVVAGAACYIATHIALWIVAGRPDGVERYLADFIRTRRGPRRRPGENRL